MKYTDAFSTFAVSDIDAAERFYQDTLGLPVQKLDMGALNMELDGATVMIYPKADHSPANFTVLNFAVDDIEVAVDELTANGISFERYEGFGQDEKGIARDDGPLIAWFTDPAGNILSVLQKA